MKSCKQSEKLTVWSEQQEMCQYPGWQCTTSTTLAMYHQYQVGNLPPVPRWQCTTSTRLAMYHQYQVGNVPNTNFRGMPHQGMPVFGTRQPQTNHTQGQLPSTQHFIAVTILQCGTLLQWIQCTVYYGAVLICMYCGENIMIRIVCRDQDSM